MARKPKTDTPADLLRTTGEALHGVRWQAPLARDLGRSLRTMQDWAAGRRTCPASIVPDLLRLVDARAVELATLAERLKAIG